MTRYRQRWARYGPGNARRRCRTRAGGLEDHARAAIQGPAHEVRVLPDVAEGLVEAAERLEGLAAHEEVAERDVVRRPDGAAPGIPLVRRHAAADPRRREKKVREALAPGRVARAGVRPAGDVGVLESRARRTASQPGSAVASSSRNAKSRPRASRAAALRRRAGFPASARAQRIGNERPSVSGGSAEHDDDFEARAPALGFLLQRPQARGQQRAHAVRGDEDGKTRLHAAS